MIWWIYAGILPPVAYALRETRTLLPHEVDEARRLLKQVRH